MSSERDAIYRVCDLAESIGAEAGRPLYAFLALFSLLRQGASSGVFTSPEGGRKDLFFRSPNAEKAAPTPLDGALALSDGVEIRRIAFSPRFKQEEVMIRVRAAEYLVHGAFSFSFPGRGAPPISREAARERWALAEAILSPLFARARVHFFHEGALAPLAWPTFGWRMPRIQQGLTAAPANDKFGEKNGGKNAELGIGVGPSGADIPRAIPLALFVRAHVLQAAVERGRRSYKRALQLLEAARGVVRVVFADDSTRRWTFLLLAELRARGDSAKEGPARVESYLKAAEAALPVLLSSERRYCAGVLAAAECQIHHAIFCEAAGPSRNLRTCQKDLKTSVWGLKRRSAIYTTWIGEGGGEEGGGLMSSFASSTAKGGVDRKWIAGLAEKMHSCCFISLFGVPTGGAAESRADGGLHANEKKPEAAEEAIPEVASENALQLARVLGFYHSFACMLEVYLALPPSQKLSSPTNTAELRHLTSSSSPLSSSPPSPLLELQFHLDRCVRLFDQREDVGAKGKGDFRILRELVRIDSTIDAKGSSSVGETLHGRPFTGESGMLCEDPFQKIDASCADEEIQPRSPIQTNANPTTDEGTMTHPSCRTMWTSSGVRRAITLYLELCRHCYPVEDIFLRNRSPNAAPERAVNDKGNAPHAEADAVGRSREPAEGPSGADFPFIDDVASPGFPEELLSPDDPAWTQGAPFQGQIARIEGAFNALRSAIEEELLGLTGNACGGPGGAAPASRGGPPRTVCPLRSGVFPQIRFLLQLKAAALMGVIAGNLVQLRVVRAVGYLRELQAFLQACARATWGMRAEMHLLAACVALHLSVRDLPRGLLGEGHGEEEGGVVDAFFAHWGRAPSAGRSPYQQGEIAEGEEARTDRGGGGGLGEEDLIARDVGLPMAHLLTAEWYLQSSSVVPSGTSGYSPSPSMLLLQLFKAIAVGKVASEAVELEFLCEPPSSGNTPTNHSKRPPMRSTEDGNEETEAIDLKRPRFEQKEKEEGSHMIDGVSSFSGGYALRGVALSQRRRCAAALTRMVQSLTHHYHATLHQDEQNINSSAGLSHPSTLALPKDHEKGVFSFFPWSSLHCALLFFLKGFLALKEDCDEDAAMRAFRLAVRSSWRSLSPLHPCVIDSLVQSSIQPTRREREGENGGDLGHAEKARNSSNGAVEEETRLLSSFLVSVLNSLRKGEKTKEEGEGDSSFASIVLRAAACASCSTLFRLLEAFEEGNLRSSGEVTSNLPQYPFNYSKTFLLENIRAWWGMQVRQLCEKEVPEKACTPQEVMGAAHRRDLVEALGFLPNMLAYNGLK